jgi:hypothetical protein
LAIGWTGFSPVGIRALRGAPTDGGDRYRMNEQEVRNHAGFGDFLFLFGRSKRKKIGPNAAITL